jgi:hypothetical protein
MIVAIGLAISLALKWTLGSLPPGDANRPGETDATPAALSQPSDEQDPRADPLIPPIRVAGLLPPLTRPQTTPVSLLNPSIFVDAFSHDPQAAFHPHGEQVCASGCAASRHPTEELTESRFRRLIAQYAHQPISENSMALETLLYFGRQTREMLAAADQLHLDPERAAVLARELSVTHARISIRVVDREGEVRTWLSPTRVPFDRRHVFEMETSDVQPLVTSGTVKRVGLYHLWTRL